jgi:hypothetical protein
MPVNPANKKRYPPEWPAISRRIRFERAGGQCEWVEDGVRCEARNGQPNPVTGSKVVLTVAHLDHTPENCEEANLGAYCQLHHLRLDARHHAKNAAETRRKRQQEAGQLALEVEG